MGKIFISRKKRLRPIQLSVLPGLLEKRGRHGAHAGNTGDLDGLDLAQPVLLGEGEDGGELLPGHLSIPEPGHLQPLDGSHQDLGRPGRGPSCPEQAP